MTATSSSSSTAWGGPRGDAHRRGSGTRAQAPHPLSHVRGLQRQLLRHPASGRGPAQYLIIRESIKRLHRRYRDEKIEIPFPIRTIVPGYDHQDLAWEVAGDGQDPGAVGEPDRNLSLRDTSGWAGSPARGEVKGDRAGWS